MSAKRYTILCIPEREGRTRSWSVSRAGMRLGIWLAVLLCVILVTTGFFTYRYVIVSQRVVQLQKKNGALLQDNAHLRTAIGHFKKTRTAISYLEDMAMIENVRRSATADSAILTALSHLRDTSAAAQASHRIAYNIDTFLQATPNIMPVDGWITEEYAMIPVDGAPQHPGIDIAVATGSPVCAAAGGRVDAVQQHTYFGLLITLSHENGFVTRYAHLSRALVAQGDQVKKGQTIALSGNSGHSSGPHLHYEILHNGSHVDPARYIMLYARQVEYRE